MLFPAGAGAGAGAGVGAAGNCLSSPSPPLPHPCLGSSQLLQRTHLHVAPRPPCAWDAGDWEVEQQVEEAASDLHNTSMHLGLVAPSSSSSTASFLTAAPEQRSEVVDREDGAQLRAHCIEPSAVYSGRRREQGGGSGGSEDLQFFHHNSGVQIQAGKRRAGDFRTTVAAASLACSTVAPRRLRMQGAVGDWGAMGSRVFGGWRKLSGMRAGFGKVLRGVWDVNGSARNNVVSSKLPEAQGANSTDIVVPPAQLLRIPSPDVLAALRLALSRLILEPNVTLIKPVEALRKGCLINNKRIYRQAFVIRYSEVGADKSASIETITNLFQEVALNHVLHSGVGADGFGTTKAMFECGLIWVVRRMYLEVDQYPAWGSMVEIDSWVASHSQASNGMRRDWIARDIDTKAEIARGTSQWVLMDMQTRRMARMPKKVRDEITPFFHDKNAIAEEVFQKIRELDDSATFVQAGLKPHRNDLDLNRHVNNVKYIPWILESVPSEVLDKLEPRSITMEYRRECNQQDVVISLTSPEEMTKGGVNNGSVTEALPSTEAAAPVTARSNHFSRMWHTLRKDDGSVIITAKTAWASKRQR